MTSSRKTLRTSSALINDIADISAELHQSENQTIEDALKLYRDYHFLQNKASFVNEQILHIVQSSLKMLEKSVNSKTNKVLSELAVQAAIQNFILADSLSVSQKDLRKYRLQALDFLEANNRVLRLDEVVDE